MNVSAGLGLTSRWLCVFALSVLTGCAVSGSQSSLEETNTPVSPQLSWDSPQTDPAAADTAWNTQTLSTSGNSSLGMELASSSGREKLLIDTDPAEGKYHLTRLTSPSRLVLDLPGQKIASSQTLTPQGASLISQIRLGAHPDKTRVVLDLGDNTGVTDSISSEDGKLVVTLAREGSDVSTSSTQTTADVSSPATETRQTAMLPRLTNMSIERTGPSNNMLILEMQSPGSFNLAKSAPSEYVLTLPGTTIEPTAATTIIAPPAGNGAGQIRSVRPLVKDNNVELRIFASPETTLDAASKGDRILVSAKVSGAAASGDVMAQMDPDAAAEAAEAKPAEGAAAAPLEVSPVGAGDENTDIAALLTDAPAYTGRLISLDLQDTDIDNALRIIAEVSNLNIIASDDVTGKVTLRLIDVPWDQALDVILKTNGLDKVQEGNVIRIAPVEKLRLEREALKQAKQAEEELEPLQVKYIRVSYAKAAELKPLIESVISERGTVAYDERTNQVIIKDIRKGVKNVAQLISKLDLRTPQVLLETQIVEATRSMTRDLGSQLGFSYIRSPETGNATGYNFPNSINIGGSVDPTNPGLGSSFPAAISSAAGSAVNFLFDSADGSKGLDVRLSMLEQEGRIRVVSRPSVATTNNKPATIKSVEKIRVKMPNGGFSVATGAGSTASGNSGVATEVIELGITLDVTPQASPDYFVLLDIKAKSSTFGSKVVDGIPSEVERSALSSVLVSSGQTFALGGIYKLNDKDNVGGVPFFKDIPFLGHLFRNQFVEKSDEELIFFITPRIIEGSFDDAAMKSQA